MINILPPWFCFLHCSFLSFHFQDLFLFFNAGFTSALSWMELHLFYSGGVKEAMIFLSCLCLVLCSLFCSYSCINPCKMKNVLQMIYHALSIPVQKLHSKKLLLAISNGQWSLYSHYAVLQSRQQECWTLSGCIFHFHLFWWIPQLLSDLHRVSLDLN